MARSSRQERLHWARLYIIQHPTVGKDAINKAIRKEYGVGLRRIDVARLKETTLIGRPKARTGLKPVAKLLKEEILKPDISERAKTLRVATIGFDAAFMALRSAGFSSSEIRIIFGAPNVPQLFSTPEFEAMLRDRRQWIRQMRKAGKSKEQILAAIERYYATIDKKTGKPKNSPFDFLRDAAYRQPRRGRMTIPEYRAAQQRKAERKTAKLKAAPLRRR